MLSFAMYINSKNYAFIRELTEDGSYYIRSYDRDSGVVVKEIKCLCNHHKWSIKSICEHPRKNDIVIESCQECRTVRSYNITTGQNKDIFCESALFTICRGPMNTVLGADTDGRVSQLQLQESGDLICIHTIKTKQTYVRHMCYVEMYDIIVLSCMTPGHVCAVKRSDGSTLWEFNQQLNGKDIDPQGVCHDMDGCVYVANFNRGVIRIDGRTGDFLQELLQDVEFCHDVCWTNTQPQVTLLYWSLNGNINTFNVQYQCQK